MGKIELLAPAGSVEAFYAGIDAGADAVYLGGTAFNARMFAENMDLPAIKDLAFYAHERGVKVYVTLNTVVFASEWDNLKQFIAELYEAKVDALIVQDFGVAHHVRSNYPDYPLHASTQMNIHTLAGVQELKRLGFERVILAREVPLETVKEMVKEGIEIEVFVHGALCFSHSGNCYLSSSIGPRSGNRGQCAQPCRKTYSLYRGNTPIGNYQALLSMKDLMTIEYIGELIQAGVASLKIEGRMKRPDYVYTVVSSYRKVIDQIFAQKEPEIDETMRKKLRVSFNRDFTKGYLLDEPNHLLTNPASVNHQGIPIGKVVKQTSDSVVVRLTETLRLQDGIRIVDEQNSFGFTVTKMMVKGESVREANKGDLVTLFATPVTKSGATVLKTLDRQMGDRTETGKRLVFIDGFLRILPAERLSLTVSDGEYTVEAAGPIVLEKANKKQSIDRFLAQIQKTGETPYVFANLKHDIDDSFFVSVQTLNQLRRDALGKLSDFRGNKVSRKFLPYNFPDKAKQAKTANSGIEVWVSSLEQLQIAQRLGVETIYCDIPDSLESEVAQAVPILQRVYDDNDKHYPVAMVHSLSQLSRTLHPIVSPYFNLANPESLTFVQSFGVTKAYLSFENSWDEIRLIAKNKPQDLTLGCFCYGRYDTMVTSHCMISKALGFDHKHCQTGCRMRYHLLDEFQNKMPLVTTPDCRVRILSHKVINLSSYISDLQKVGVENYLLVFTDETGEETRKIITGFQKVVRGESETLTIPQSTVGHFKERVG